MRLLATILSWLLALAVAGVIGADAFLAKLQRPAGEDPIFAQLAARSGYALFEPSFRFGFGLVEMLAALLILLPWTRKAGADLAFLLCAGALAMHFSPWMTIEAPILAGGPPADGGALFFFACFMLGATLLLRVVEGGRRRAARLA